MYRYYAKPPNAQDAFWSSFTRPHQMLWDDWEMVTACMLAHSNKSGLVIKF